MEYTSKGVGNAALATGIIHKHIHAILEDMKKKEMVD